LALALLNDRTLIHQRPEAQIDELKTWAIRSGAKSASIPDVQTQSNSYSRLSPLQVDEN
jgi:hypothetical protein